MSGNTPPIPHDNNPPEQQAPLSGTPRATIVKLPANAVYFPNWRVYRGETPATLNYNCITHVYYAFANLKATGEIYLSDEWSDIQQTVDGAAGCLGSFRTLKGKYAHLKVMLSVGGEKSSNNFAAVSADAGLRECMAKSAHALLTQYDLDGIDVDWEHPSNEEEGKNFINLVADLRKELPRGKYCVTAALPAGEWALRNIDLKLANDILDFVNLMAYDFSGPWRPTAGHHAQLYPAQDGENSGSAAIDYIIRSGFPANKIILGVPVYGRSFIGATRPGENYTSKGGEDGCFEYKLLPRPGTQEVVDKQVVAASCLGSDGGFVTYDNPETIQLKGEYCHEKGLAGLFYWTGAADVAQGPRSLVEAGFRALYKLDKTTEITSRNMRV